MKGVPMMVALVLAASALAGCAAGYGGRQEQGRIVVDGKDEATLVYFLRRHDYEEKVAPLIPRGDGIAADYVARNWTGLPAQGQLIVHRAGNFNMVYFCGDRVGMLPVQILTPAVAETPNRYTPACPE